MSRASRRFTGRAWRWLFRRQSLLVQYLAVVAVYVLLVPVLYIGALKASDAFLLHNEWSPAKPARYSTDMIEQQTRETANGLAGLTDAEREKKLRALHDLYPDGELFWVDGTGRTRWKAPETAADVPEQWSVAETVRFMKASYDSDPYTVVGLIPGIVWGTTGRAQEASGSVQGASGGVQTAAGSVTPGAEDVAPDGFIAIRVPRDATYVQLPSYTGPLFGFGLLGLLTALFIFLSWWFFSRLRRRVLRLQAAMRNVGEDGLPQRVEVKPGRGLDDEIHDLGRSFNRMIDELEESRHREREEEEVRKQLIASLSHDLRTPLTTLRGHAYLLNKEEMSEKGQESLRLIDEKIGFLDRLIDNLLSFTLLTTGRYPYHPEKKDVHRLLRSTVAAWYPALEREGFEVEVELPDEPLHWDVDVQWFQRIWDNLLQNVLRHAKAGGYVGISSGECDGLPCLVLQDRGPGLESTGKSQGGAGIGLTIVELMVQEMGLKLGVETGERGTVYRLYRPV